MNNEIEHTQIKNLRIIKTARSLRAINRAVEEGYTPLIKEIEPSKDIYHTCFIVRNKRTGKINEVSDPRAFLVPIPS